MRHRILTLALIAAVAGCATPTFAPVTHYYLEPAIEIKPVQMIDKTLGIRPLEAARPYKHNVVYRSEGFIQGQVKSAEWAELPDAVVTRALTDAIVATHRFKDVGNASDLKMPDLILTGEVRKFDEDRTVDPWVAECEVRFELRPAEGAEPLWAATLSTRVPLEQNDISALAAAMSRAVAQAVQKAAAGIAAL